MRDTGGMDFTMDDALRLIGLKEATITMQARRLEEADRRMTEFSRHECVPTPCTRECCREANPPDSVPEE